MPPDRQSPNAIDGARTTTDALEERIRRDEARLLADEARIAEDEHDLRTNRLVARIAVVLAGTLLIAVAGLTISLFALNRDIETVAKAAPKDDSVGTTALKDSAVTAAKLAPGAVGTAALADGGVRRADLGAQAVGHVQLRPGSVTGANVRRNALTGVQIDERTLRNVASAQSAVRANTAHDAQSLGGAAASAYLSRIMIVRAASSANQQRTKGPIAARCPTGMRIVAGGAAVDGTSHGVAIARSAPNGDQDWVAVANSYHRPTVPWRLVVSAVCVAGGAA
jgi:hypothetical protein